MEGAQQMSTLELKDGIATVTLSEIEAKLLCIMAQYWVEGLPGDSPLAIHLSQQLQELASKLDIH